MAHRNKNLLEAFSAEDLLELHDRFDFNVGGKRRREIGGTLGPHDFDAVAAAAHRGAVGQRRVRNRGSGDGDDLGRAALGGGRRRSRCLTG